jgi:hypothetical protein
LYEANTMPAVSSRAPNEMIHSCSINSMFRNKEDVLSLKMQSIVIMLIASIALEHIEHGTRNIRMYTETSV